MDNLNLDYFLADTLVQHDLAQVFWKENSVCEFEFENETISVPSDVKLEVVSKVFRQSNYQIGFGTHYSVQVAIGGVKKCESGILYPEYCFATLFYNQDFQMITSDIHQNMR